MSKTATRTLLNRTAEILNERGLAKHTHRAPDGTVCVWGALELARVELDMSHGTGMEAGMALHLANGRRNPSYRNDQTDSTLTEMVAIVERAKALV